MSMRVLCIWLPNWPSQRATVALSQADPSLESPRGPIILHARDARRGRLVAAANATARAMGILPHMPLSQASTLCPSAKLVEHDPQADLEILRSLAEAAQCFSPIVGIESLDDKPWAGRSLHQPQCLLLDVTGIGPLFSGEESLAQSVHRWVAAQGYFASIAIANNIGTAWALANYTHRNRIAKDMAAIETTRNHCLPYVTVILAPQPTAPTECDDSLASAHTNTIHHSVTQATYPLPIEALRLEQATVAKLHRLGIRKIGQLVELPRNGLASRFDSLLLTRMDQTLENRYEPIVTLHATPELAIDELLEHPTPVRETIDFILEKQIGQLCKVLDSMGHGVVRLVCRIDMERNAIPVESDVEHKVDEPSRVSRVFQIGLYQPSNDASHLGWLLRGQLDAHNSHGPSHFWTRSVSIQATLTAPLTWQQSDLFDRHVVVHRDAIAKLVDNLSARMGRNAVVAPVLHRDPQPELAYSWRPLTGWRTDGTAQDTKRKLARQPKRDFAESHSISPNNEEQWRRPLKLIQPPKPLEVERVDADGNPTKIRFQNTICALHAATGPERIDTGWWHGATQQRDYYRVALSHGPWLWIFRDRRDNRWYLHGEFD